MTNDDDGIDWEDWMSMTEKEQNKEFAIAMRQYGEMIKNMSAKEYYYYSRGNTIRILQKYRKILKDHPTFEFVKPIIRERQKRLVSLRMSYYHQTKIGTA